MQWVSDRIGEAGWWIRVIAAGVGVVSVAGSIVWDVLVALVVGVVVMVGVFSVGLMMQRRIRKRERLPSDVSEGEPSGPPPPSSPPQQLADEALVIVCRRYALPAYEAVSDLLTDVFTRCFKCGGWRGLAAALARKYVLPKGADAAKNVEATINDSSTTLTAALVDFFDKYDALMGLAYQFGKHDLALDPDKLEQWNARDRLFETRLADLAAGVDRDDLAVLTHLTEGRVSLRDLRSRDESG